MSYLAATGDLLAVARAALRERLVPRLDGEGRYDAAMVGNAMAIAIRELELGGAARAAERRLLARFLGSPQAALPELRASLCRELRSGAIQQERSSKVAALLRELVHARLAISNPDYLAQEVTPADGGHRS